ncbi:phospholipase D-like domain-containing protein [Ramlibacter sp.]|uniref:phospholipase D-like domain-containing protein n=1 Tax=Ramlibacter sp. TaxID=1917967 RepID=UPI003D127460
MSLRIIHWIAMSILLLCATACASLPANGPRPPSQAWSAPDATALGRLVQTRRAESGSRSASGFKLIDVMEQAYTSRLALAKGAERTIDIQSYAIHADASTETLLQELRQAARRGVRVRILLDDFNSVGDDAQVLRLGFEPNVEVRLFNPLPGPRNNLFGRVMTSLHDIPRIQKRMHNKLFIADNAWGITGGRNIGDRFFGTGEKLNFVDLDVLAAGAVVREMSTSFDRYWNDPLAYPVQAILSKEDLERLQALPGGGATADGSPNRAKPLAAVSANSPTILPNISRAEAQAAAKPPLDLRTVPLVWAPSTFLGDKPGKIAPGDDEVDAGDTVIDGLLSIMRGARREVVIVSPYLVPGPQMMAVYAELRQRGVRIRMLTNTMASNDAPAAHAGYLRYREAMLKLGIELHEMRVDPATTPQLAAAGSSGKGSRASLHTKAVVVDGSLAIVGSMNLDLRSQIQNSEVALVIRSAPFAAQVLKQVDDTVASNAYRLDLGSGKLVWRAPPGAPFKDSTGEPDAPLKMRALVTLIGPFAPEEML